MQFKLVFIAEIVFPICYNSIMIHWKEQGLHMGSSKICPNCGRKMKQQFIGLQHCSCGTSWNKSIGFFERTPDMVFALERRTVGKKIQQVPVIRNKE